uniref:choice-of-anchor L domain-containing protein n=1 Tax=uncultured Lacinutrix sp. TaxID=574032 RepID=UPI002617E372
MKNITLIIILFFISLTVTAQDILMQNGTFNQCSGTLYDSGGSASNYSSDENFVLTLCPDGPDQFIQIAFTFFSTQQNLDVLTIYDGDDTTAPVLGTFSGGGAANNPGTISASTTSATGCITLEFTSDATGNTIGWAADISCLQSCQTITPTIDTTVPAATAGVIQIPAGGSIDFTGSAVFSDDGTGATYSWIPGDGTAAVNGQTATVTYNNIGTFTTTLSVTDTNPTGCTETTTITVEVLSPLVIINNTTDAESTYDIQQLISDVLVSGGCSAVDNFSFQVNGAAADTNTKSYGYFRRGGAVGFPFNEGVILSTGRASGGGNTTAVPANPNPSFNNGQPGDADLEAALGQTNTNDATFVKFNFVPTADSISFRFVMASEEYDGNTECNFADSFAFLLREVGTVPYTNLAVLPDGVTPVSVTNINGSAVCNANPGFFAGYNLPDTNYGGRTVVLTATANVLANTTYEIKLVVADQGDSIWDSAIFLEAGSFNLGGDLGDDITIAAGTAQCEGEIVTLDTQTDPTVPHVWYLDGAVIPGETSSTVDVTQSGTYSVDVVFAASCTASDSVVIEFFPGIVTATPDNLFLCNPGTPPYVFDLTQNDAVVTAADANPSDLVVTYYETQMDADNETSPIPNPNAYSSSAVIGTPQTIFIRVEYLASDCYETESFTLNITSQPVINPVLDMELCDDASNDDTEPFDLESQSATILGGQIATDYTVTYHLTLAEATAGTGALVSLYNNIANPQPIFVRVELNSDASCVNVTTNPLGEFNLIVNERDDASFTTTPTCDGGTINSVVVPGGTYAFNPLPTDTAVIDPVTGAVTNGTSGSTYTIEYTTNGVCPSTGTETVTVITADDSTFTMLPTCDGGTVDTVVTPGGTYIFNPLPTDTAVIDPVTGTVTGGTSGATYTIEYTSNGACPTTMTQTVTVLPIDDSTFTMIPTCDGGTVDSVVTPGGTYVFNPLPTDAAIIDATTGTITNGTSGASYTVDYTSNDVCPTTSSFTVTVNITNDASFTMLPTCDGGTVDSVVTPGGVYAFNPLPTDT